MFKFKRLSAVRELLALGRSLPPLSPREAHGIWHKLWERLQTEDGHDALHLLIDATIAEEMVMHMKHATVHG